MRPTRNEAHQLSPLHEDNWGDIAQLVEHLLCKQGVTGSNPVVSIIPCYSLMSASAELAAKRTSGNNPRDGFKVSVWIRSIALCGKVTRSWRRCSSARPSPPR